jgi:hypothetical protein
MVGIRWTRNTLFNQQFAQRRSEPDFDRHTIICPPVLRKVAISPIARILPSSPQVDASPLLQSPPYEKFDTFMDSHAFRHAPDGRRP